MRSERSGIRRPKGPLPWIIAGVALLICAPLLVVLTAPLHAPAPEWDHVATRILPSHLWETLLLLGWTLMVALVLGVGTAWLVASYRLPLRGLLDLALVLPLALPTYVSAITYASLLGPTGSISLAVRDAVGWHMDIMDIRGLGMVMGLVLYPYIYLPVRAVFARGMSAELDAARTLGARGRRRFLSVALPLARPAIVGGALLVAMETLNDYGAVKYYGIRTLTTGIFRSWSGLYDLGSALRLGGVLLLMIATFLWIEKRVRGSGNTETDQRPVRSARLAQGTAWLATGACLLVVTLGALLPMGSLLGDALTGGHTMPGERLLPAVGNTLLVATLAAVATLLVALAFGFLDRHAPSGKWRWLIRGANLGYVVPGAVIAVGVMTIAGRVDRDGWLPVMLIGSLGLLVAAFVVRFLAVAGQPLRAALRQQPRALDEAAMMLGARPLRIYMRINIPLLGRTLLAATMLVAIDVIKELPLTLILRPFDLDTLSTAVFELAMIEELPQAALPALLIVLFGMAPVLVLNRIFARE